VRFLTRDDENQFQRARKLIARETSAGVQVFVSLLVLLETEWVLRSRYSLRKSQILHAVGKLLSTVEIRFEDEAAVEEAMFMWRHHTVDFADCLIVARNRRLGCESTATFDTRAARLPWVVAV
jgi:predicted nucleic-acid-binding protein